MFMCIQAEVFLYKTPYILVEVLLILVKTPCDTSHGLPVPICNDVALRHVIPKQSSKARFMRHLSGDLRHWQGDVIPTFNLSSPHPGGFNNRRFQTPRTRV
jgi:hypothetical protein